MTIAMSEELQSLIQHELESGRYDSADEVLLAAVRLLRERDQRLSELRAAIEPALARLDRGEGRPLDMEEIKAEARRRFEQAWRMPSVSS